MQVIKDRNGKVIGRFMPSSSGKTYGQTPTGQTKGYYDSAVDKTFTPEGRVVSTGNTLAALLV